MPKTFLSILDVLPITHCIIIIIIIVIIINDIHHNIILSKYIIVIYHHHHHHHKIGFQYKLVLLPKNKY